MTRYSRKKGNNAPNRRIGKRSLKTKRYKKDLDQIKAGLINAANEQAMNADTKPAEEEQEDLDLPASGKFFCLHCE